MHLRYYILQGNFKKAQQVFKTAKKNLGGNGHEIWKIYMLYLRTLGYKESVMEFNSLVDDLIQQHDPNFNEIKANILELQALVSGIEAARETYHLFTKHYPNCCIHEKIADLESKYKVFMDDTA